MEYVPEVAYVREELRCLPRWDSLDIFLDAEFIVFCPVSGIQQGTRDKDTEKGGIRNFEDRD